jgi:hypothetical protein
LFTTSLVMTARIVFVSPPSRQQTKKPMQESSVWGVEVHSGCITIWIVTGTRRVHTGGVIHVVYCTLSIPIAPARRVWYTHPIPAVVGLERCGVPHWKLEKIWTGHLVLNIIHTMYMYILCIHNVLCLAVSLSLYTPSFFEILHSGRPIGALGATDHRS